MSLRPLCDLAQTGLFDFRVRDFLTADATSLGDTTMTHLAGNVSEYGVRLLDVENALLFGHYYWELPAGDDSVQASLFFQDGCAQSSDADDCSTFEVCVCV